MIDTVSETVAVDTSNAPFFAMSWACDGSSVVAATRIGEMPSVTPGVTVKEVGEPAWFPVGWR